MVEDGYDKDIENGVPPANDDARTVGLGHVRWPEHSHEPIMLYHDSLPDNASGREPDEGCDKGALRRSHVVGAARGQRRRYREREGAIRVSDVYSQPVCIVMPYQICLLSRKEEDRDEDGEEETT